MPETMPRRSVFETPILDSHAVAVALDLSPDVVNELARKRVLPAYKEGRRWRFRRADVVRFLDQTIEDEAPPRPPVGIAFFP